MGERTYPREWFRVSRWSKKPEPCEFQRETAHRLFMGTRSYYKLTEYECWYPTLEEAQAVIDARNAEADEAARMKRIRDAAPELLEACQAFLERFDGGSRADTDFVAGLMRAAIAKARGQ